MAASFAEQGFFGGAIGGVIPQGWIDASTLREVPDHQEVFLSPTTLSNVIFEINQRVTRDQALGAMDQQAVPAGGAPSSTETIDKAAALYHLHDFCDEGDSVQVIIPPRAISLPKFASPVPAYQGVVSFTTPKRQRNAGAGGRIPVSVDGAAAGSSADGPQTSKSTCHFLLVRLEAQETDLLVFFNVPHDEFDKKGDPRELSKEEELATAAIGKMAESLEIKDWGLFV